MREVLVPAIEDLCAAFELGGYNPTPVIDIGVLVANADGVVNASEHALLGEVFQTLLETTLTRELVDVLIQASVEVIKVAGVEPRVRLVGAILQDCDAAEAGLRVALAIAFATEGLSTAEKAVVHAIAEASGVPADRVEELVEEVRKHTDAGGPASARRSLLPAHLRDA